MNVKRVLCFRKAGVDGRVLTVGELEQEFNRQFEGVNFYYGINEQNLATYTASPERNPLNATHQAFFQAVLDGLEQGAPASTTVVLGVEPPQITNPYGFVANAMPLVESLASALDQLQQKASATGKQLDIVLRYASEMNDRAAVNKYAGDSLAYRESFRAVRTVFANVAPRVLFAFSPAIRADLAEPTITDYWPGDEFVDVISCTWYIGSKSDYNKCTVFMKAYFLHRLGSGKLLGVDEIGGCRTVKIPPDPEEHGVDNDGFLRNMFAELKSLASDQVQFEYATVFLEGKWGEDATLSWL
jgi:hypothetical protein